MKEVRQLINRLALERHPEGGWFRETYRSEGLIPSQGLPAEFTGPRSFATAIYFLLARGELSTLHRIKSDEMWHFYSGTSLTIHVISPTGDYQQLKLGPDIADDENFQAMVPAGSWFGAEVSPAGSYALAGCTVAPGFDFTDFELASRAELLRTYPEHQELIVKLTRD